MKVSAAGVYADEFGAKSKRSRKWHFFVATFSGKMNVYLFYCLRLSDGPREAESGAQKYAIWQTRGRKKEGAVKLS